MVRSSWIACVCALLVMTSLQCEAFPALRNLSDFKSSPEDQLPARDESTLKAQLRGYAQHQYLVDLAEAAAPGNWWIASQASRYAKPAVVFDIDETALSNLPAMVVNNFEYSKDTPCPVNDAGRPVKAPCGAIAWDQSLAAPALKPTLDLYRTARAHGVAVFFITGRDESERTWTLENLKRVGYSEITGLIMSAPPKPAWVGQFKTAARQSIEAQGYRILLSTGDQVSDVYGGHTDRIILYPNPFYRLP